MNLKRLWCLLVIIAFSMPVFAATPYQIDSMDDINDVVGGGADPNWVEATGSGYGSYMEQANDVNMEGTGSMKFDFNDYEWPNKNDEVTRTFSPALDFNNYKELAITLWDWTEDPNDSRPFTLDSRLREIILYDGSARVGIFTVLPLKNVGWNKVIAPLRNFIWKSGVNPVDPCDVDWDDITKIGLFARTEHYKDDPNEAQIHPVIYLDDMQLEWAPPQPTMPYQVASFDDINDEAWVEDHGLNLMLQTPPGDPCMEGDSSMMCDYDNHGPADWDITPIIRLVPALDFTDGNDWAITLWVWTDLVLDAYLWEVSLHDVCGNIGRSRVPRADINDLNGYGWNKITIRIDELLWDEGLNFPIKTSDEVCLDAIVAVELWTMTFPFWGNSIYLDDLRIEPAVEALSEAGVYNADYTPVELTIDGNASDWAGLVDSDPIDFDIATINFTPPPNYPTTPPPGTWNHTGSGDLHVKYRLAWDLNYLYILIEEQPGDNLATEAANLGDYILGGFNDFGTYFDGIALSFDFTNNRIPGVNVMMGLWLYLGLGSSGQTDLMGALLNTLRGVHNSAPLVNGSVATSGTWTSSTVTTRVIEAKLKWSDLDGAIDTWFQPAGGIEAAVKPGYIFGCDPRLLDTEDSAGPWDATHGMGWFSGIDYAVSWPQGYHRWPTGRDIFSTDIRLVCSAGDLDFDCDVDFVDYAQFAAKWLDSGCNNLNDFCNGADIVIPMDGEVDPEDLDRFTERWLD